MQICLLCAVLPTEVKAQFSYTTNNGAITITGYSGSGSVIIPDTINGYPVTGIGNAAFEARSDLTSFTIPDSVTNIADYAFYSCFGLTNVTIGSGVIGIGNFVFYQCTKLANITFGTNVSSIGLSSFYYCTSLTSVTIPNAVTRSEGHTSELQSLMLL